MMAVSLRHPDEPMTALCLGAHCDDIEIGCGGALLSLRRRYPKLQVRWVVFTSEAERAPETRAAARRLLGTDATVQLEGFRASYFPDQWARIKDVFESLKTRGPRPDLILTHALADRHQDHRVIAELTWSTFRDHLVLEYEIPKYEGDLGHPNVFVPLTRAEADEKVATLMESFPSQHSRTWFTEDMFRGHLRMRGVECNAPEGFAEAFHARKVVL